ncbi:hypothetical protein HPP92_002076 [Vanilla planifolia]|uniref:HMA domain-containing protein n=1 Tax=Vanilla planifolia TaxID=51239 RepID=A0A835RT94_VANPL|nr:hypothetical protein HPP92_002335 [Vanilla planifolia]KAG0502004.1 hypothetical protein HPP92_002076 [Vanilla planifolia]
MGYLRRLLGFDHTHKKRRQFNTVELKVRMDCDGCELKVKNALSNMKGVHSVEINRKQNKVTVTGYIEPRKVLKRVQHTGKRVEMWPYVPYNLVMHPYVVGTYDKRAPPGHVRNVETITAPSSAMKEEEKYTKLFSDDNPNACSIM